MFVQKPVRVGNSFVLQRCKMLLSYMKVKVQVFYSLISSLKTYHRTLHFTPWSCAISTPRGAYSSAAISAHWTYRTHWHLCPTRYSFSPESSEAFEGEVSSPRTHHLNNVPRLRGEKHDISLKILHQAGLETARQAATSAERHATIAPCPSHRLWRWPNIKTPLVRVTFPVRGPSLYVRIWRL